jgi:small subunit ribosomal protein S6
MLDPEAADERRDQIAADARNRIEAGGNLKSDSAWGMRKLAFEIRQRTEADYRFFRFETGGTLLDDLNHNLKIADGVLRFRIFKVDPRSPVIVPPPPTPLSSGAPARGGRRGDGPGRRGDGRPPRGDRGPRAEPAAAARQPSEGTAKPSEGTAQPGEGAPQPSEGAPPTAEPETPAPSADSGSQGAAEGEQPPADEPAPGDEQQA